MLSESNPKDVGAVRRGIVSRRESGAFLGLNRALAAQPGTAL